MVEFNKILTKNNCPQCGCENALNAGQLNHRGKLRWYETVNCTNCGLRSEADGGGIPPVDIRQKIIDYDGLWRVNVLQVISKKEILKVIRKALSIDMKEASRLAKDLPGNLYVGTKEEAIWIADLLIKVGESPNVGRVE
ncbi:hypothetical protein [Leeia aquatica]|uniref:Uncharacterized protein n=1 Tax=Leeia aquatica TaxID=2725557 RepID=A0A847S316_9NEIS|nr:hypothetical protein [Leeia aquatica]NLR74183.1 hypothetical protein [Leeia aquatica]